MKASLASFVERIGYEDVGLLSRDFEPAAALKRSQGGPRALRFSVRDSELQAVGNVVDTRSKVMTALGVEQPEGRLQEAAVSALIASAAR